jgi:hypothetical protein
MLNVVLSGIVNLGGGLATGMIGGSFGSRGAGLMGTGAPSYKGLRGDGGPGRHSPAPILVMTSTGGGLDTLLGCVPVGHSTLRSAWCPRTLYDSVPAEPSAPR